MDDLRTKLIRLAQDDKSLRPLLLPILAADRLIVTAQEVADQMVDLDVALSHDKRASN